MLSNSVKELFDYRKFKLEGRCYYDSDLSQCSFLTEYLETMS